MKCFNVHMFVSVRVKVCGIEAESPLDAIRTTESINLDGLLNEHFITADGETECRGEVAHIEYCDDISAYLVDEQGDENYENSQSFEADGKTLISGPNQADRVMAFAKSIAAKLLWGELDDEGEPFEPSDGLEDSHQCLMDLIEEARGIVGNPHAATEDGDDEAD